MKNLILLVTALALIGAASLRAADDAKPAKPSAEEIKKYDKNSDGKLDKEEKAAMRAAEKGAKKKKDK